MLSSRGDLLVAFLVVGAGKGCPRCELYIIQIVLLSLLLPLCIPGRRALSCRLPSKESTAETHAGALAVREDG